MFTLIYEIFKYLVSAISDLINIIMSIPEYIGYIMQYVGLLPPSLKVFVLVMIPVIVIIGVKRLIL